MTLTIVHTAGDDTLARVFVGETEDGSCIEFVESVQPPVPRDQKWVLIVSTLKGCPVNCPICDAGGHYRGRLSTEEILAQIDYLVRRRFSDGIIPTPLVKIQFARMGDPAFNRAVLDVLRLLPARYDMPGLMPSISTVAPHGSDDFIRELKTIKTDLYNDGRFQMQFSVHTTCDKRRRQLIPIKTLNLERLSAVGASFFDCGDRKVTLNFAAVAGFPVDPRVIARYFSPERFIIKLTPVNPTMATAQAKLNGRIEPGVPDTWTSLKEGFSHYGFDTIVSIGEQRENQIGSNCGMYVRKRQ